MNRTVVLITGASSDLGCELLSQLSESDAILLAHYNRSGDRVEEFKRSARRAEIVPLQADFASENQIIQLIGRVRSEYAMPNQIVHLAAPKLRYERFADFDSQRFHLELDVQLKSLILLLAACLPAMVKRREEIMRANGKVVVVLSSVTANVPPKFMSTYTTLKYAQLGLVRALASEYAGRGVNINAVSPSMMETRFLDDIPTKARELSAQQNPTGRNATVQDVVPAIRYLLARESDYITGANIPVTGGSVF